MNCRQHTQVEAHHGHAGKGMQDGTEKEMLYCCSFLGSLLEADAFLVLHFLAMDRQGGIMVFRLGLDKVETLPIFLAFDQCS